MGCFSSKHRRTQSDVVNGNVQSSIPTNQSQTHVSRDITPQSSIPTNQPQTHVSRDVNEPQIPTTTQNHHHQQEEESEPVNQLIEEYQVFKPSKPIALLETETILGKPFEQIKRLYTLGHELGRGQFGITYTCKENSTGNTYACKSILKRKLTRKQDRDDVKKEIQIMQHLSGQQNIVEIRGAYEDRQSIHLVMELCGGGELFDRIIAQGHYSERAAAGVIRSVLNVVQICHFMGVMHRDLKPENFLLGSKDEDAMLKATDFGLSVFIEEGEMCNPILSSAYCFRSLKILMFELCCGYRIEYILKILSHFVIVHSAKLQIMPF